MKVLLLDAGNTRVKWQLQDVESPLIVAEGLLVGESLTTLVAELRASAGAVDAVAVASVKAAAHLQKLIAALTEAFTVEPFVARVESPAFGLRCAYTDPGQFGVDRWLALLGARSITKKACCVVDAGSAMTFDWVSGSGEHLGGYIVPGLRLSLSALLSGTDKVLVRPQEFQAVPVQPGRNTSDAVYGGALYAAVAQIDAAKMHVGDLLGEEIELFLTGGDAELISPHLSAAHRLSGSLVYDGLKIAAGWC